MGNIYLMKSHPTHLLRIFLLLSILLISSCNHKVNPQKKAESQPTTTSIPDLTGNPLLTNSQPQPGPPNDTSLVSQYIRAIFQDSKGNYWFGPAGQSVAKYDGEKLSYFSSAEFFQGNDEVDRHSGYSVYAITEDKEGHIWFGTDRGAVKYDGQKFRSYKQEHGLTNTHVSRKSIEVDQTGQVYVGTGAGIFLYNASLDRAGSPCFSLFPLLPPHNIKDIMQDSKGNMWIATEAHGVFRYDGKEIQQISDQKGMGKNYAGGMAEDQAGNIWFAMEDGMARYDGQHITQISLRELADGSNIWGICIEKPGIMWITARGSTMRYELSKSASDSTAFTVFTEADGINCCVQSMYQDQSGNMWWGAGSGLFRFDGKRFYQVKKKGPW